LRAVNGRDVAASEQRDFSERVNLALRQTAHHLLLAAGDRTSEIPPVEHVESGLWLVRLERNFDYDSLPPILKKALNDHHIQRDYSVSVWDCAAGELMLGYAADWRTDVGDVPCGGRAQTAGCYNLQIRFTNQESSADWAFWLLGLLALSCATLAALAIRKLPNYLKKNNLIPEKLPLKTASSGDTELRFGGSILHMNNQKLVCKGVETDLTYREAKLLCLFAQHPNQLLGREQILKLVWEDEGIIVGRSVDVFVSRLRKLLKTDDALRIVSVHGVGYRLEVSGLTLPQGL
jgi:hypothetical protein